MPVKAKIKISGDIPWALEHKLVTKYGFYVFSRNKREWLIIEKLVRPFKPELIINGELPEDIQNNLIKRCNTICNHFKEPHLHIPIIRYRLTNIASSLPQIQKQFIYDWMDRNLKEDQ